MREDRLTGRALLNRRQPSARGGRRDRRGFSLLELLLVLCLIVVIYSLATPALRRPLATQGLRKAADTVRSEWAATRSRAMRSGCIHVFEFKIGTNQYRIRPWIAPEDMVEANNATMYGIPSTQSGSVAPSRLVRNEQSQLPEDILLAGSEVDDKRWVMMSESQLAMNEMDESWSSPIFFYPDGTTSLARVLISNQYNDMVAVRLRGLTGKSRTEDVDPGEEMWQ
jgi:prepilin-type N-terminal cleavage/methylation domain-containing protein